ncbi:amidohydrolase family protein [Streptosporangium sp. NPDC004379]|uniref:amidohydrolase family protein n=1 Tax=Streptosporangium sp. NPDC004379 TaxID=3366189 RepID=UPI00369AA1CF
MPFDDLPADPRPDMDRLGIDRALVTHTLSLYSDPEDGNRALRALDDPRLLPVPVLVPMATEQPPMWDVPMVRLCPERHRFDVTGPTTRRWLDVLGLPVAVDLEEASPAQLREVSRHVPKLLILNPGYRRLRAVAELMAEAPNVYLEIGTVNTQRGVEWLAKRFGARRLVFGTGAPVMDDCGPRLLLDHLDLPPDDVALIAAGGDLLGEAGR